ncbi:hypothetical protein PIB30_069168, partial [Stylosanthes scabra]|nr:hypothetical protein [Stylosanthes scabra]
MASSSSSGSSGEALSPASKLFHLPNFNCHVIAVLGFKTAINLQVFKEGARETILKHPKFTSKLTSLTNKAIFDSVIHAKRRESVGVFRMHHSMGDGISLMSFIIASTRKSSDPDALPTMSSSTKKKEQKSGGLRFFMSLFGPFLAVWWGLVLIWHTFMSLMGFLAIFFFKETRTPLKGAPGVEHNTNCYVHRILCINDIKLLKKEMNVTFNDVLLAITQAGITRYLNRQQFGANATGSAAKKGTNSALKNIRLRAAIAVNLRAVSGIQAVADMTAKKSKVRWGNFIGYFLLPLSISLQEDPLEHVRQAKVVIERKKHSLEAVITFNFGKLILNLFGVKAVAAITRRILSNTTLVLSNLPGPIEEVTLCGHLLAYIAPGAYGGLPQ